MLHERMVRQQICNQRIAQMKANRTAPTEPVKKPQTKQPAKQPANQPAKTSGGADNPQTTDNNYTSPSI